MNQWVKKGFGAFARGKMGNGGQNLYVSAGGVLQRIFHFDVNGDGYPDLPFANSQSMGERPPAFVYDGIPGEGEPLELPCNGAFDAVTCDLTGNGSDDLVIACQNNGVHSDMTSFVYYNGGTGLDGHFATELPVPDARAVAAGDFNGDGKLDLAFVSRCQLRIFYAGEQGILHTRFSECQVNAAVIAAADFDGDGCCDLYLRLENGSAAILWGGEDGLSASRLTLLGSTGSPEPFRPTTTPGRRSAYRSWRPAAVTLNGQTCLFRMDGDDILLETCDRSRVFRTAARVRCPGAVSVCIGDFDGDGCDDLAAAVCTDRNRTEQSAVFWGGPNGFSDKRAIFFETRCARKLSAADLSGTGRLNLLVCQGGTSFVHTTSSFILAFSGDRTCQKAAEFTTHDAAALLAAGRKGGLPQVVCVNHESGRVGGDENISVYLGGADGYFPGRTVELPGRSAVDCEIFDYNDDGYPDILVVNCSENAPHLDPGSFLYTGGPEGFSPQRRVTLPSIRGHGAAVGDFRHSGYLDVAVGGFANREIRIFRGGPEGYDTGSPQKLVLGPDPDWKPFIPACEDEVQRLFSGRSETDDEYGEVRWLFAADFNGDGWLDLFVSQICGHRSLILWGGPDGFDIRRCQWLETDSVAAANAADLNGDGYLDLILSGHNSLGKSEAGREESYVTIYWGGPGGYSEWKKTMLPVTCANSVTVADFNNDGRLDIYATSYFNGRIRDIPSFLYFGDEKGVFSTENRQLLFNHSGSGCVAGDFNGDGYVDLAVACHKEYGNHCARSRVFWNGPEGLSDDRITELPTTGPHGMTSIDPGNLMDRGPAEYYYSEPYPLPEGKRVGLVSWVASLGPKNSVCMHLRQAGNEAALEDAAWQGPYVNGETPNGLPAGGFVQYRIALTAACGCGSPRITEITLEFV